MLKQPPIRSEKHRRFIASLPCIICGNTDVQCAHIRRRQGGGMGLKPCDSKCVPLCITCHKNQHESGELVFYHGFGGYEAAAVLATKLYKVSGDEEKAKLKILEWKK